MRVGREKVDLGGVGIEEGGERLRGVEWLHKFDMVIIMDIKDYIRLYAKLLDKV